MKLFSEKVQPTFTNSTFNVLQTENFSEIFFDVYEIELNKIKYPAEKVSSFRGNPVVSVPVVIGEKEQEFPFVLIKGNESIFFNESNIEVPIDDTPVEVEDTDVLFESVDIDHDHRIKEDTKREIMEHIETAKVNARKQAESIKREKLKEADTEIRKKNKLLRESLDTAKQQLVKEFISITKSIKRELINEADDKYSELTLTIDNKINDLANTLAESIQSDFENSSKELETNIRAFVKAIHNESVLPELRKSLETIATDAVVRIKGIESDLDKKLDEKVDVSVLQELSSELSALRNTNVELNNNINKGVNKALSRIGNVNNRIDEVSSDVIKQLDEKISTTADNISNYYSEKLKSLEDQTFDLNEKSRQYVVDIVRESRDNLISEIRKIQKEAPVEFVIESAGKKKTKSFDSIQKDIDKKISDRVSDEVVKLRKYIAVYSGGGGTVAQQFADGGTMNGNLTVVGAISASEYLGITGGLTGDYLPLSGGTITGDLTINGVLSADSTTGANHTIRGNTDIIGTGSNQLLVDYQNTVTINGGEGVTIQANSGPVSLSGSDGVSINGGSTGLSVTGNTSVNGTFTALSGANINGNTTITGNLTASGTVSSPEYSVTGTDGVISSTTDIRTWFISTTNTFAVGTTPHDLFFKPDGSIMYLVFGGSIDAVRAYPLSTPWDITTASAFTSKSVSSLDGEARGLYFSPDGTNMFVCGITTANIGKYTIPLSAAWNISQASTNAVQTINLATVIGDAAVSAPVAIDFNPDGSRMFVVSDDATNRVYELDLNPPWDLSSAVYNGVSTSALDVTPASLSINKDGTRMFLLGGGTATDVIKEVRLNTPWSLSSVTFVNNSVVVPDSGPQGVYFNDVSYKCFIAGNSNFVREVFIGPSLQISGTNANLQVGDIVASKTITTPSTVTADNIVLTRTTSNSNALTLQQETNIIWSGGISPYIQGYSNRIEFGAGATEWGRFSGATFRCPNFQIGPSGDTGTASITSPLSAVIKLGDSAGTSFNRLQFGGIDVNFPAIKRNGSGIDIRDAADTGFTDLRARNITAAGSSTVLNLIAGGAPLSATSSITLALTDLGRVVRYSGVAAISATVPDQSTVAWPDGSVIYLRRNAGAGTITIQGSGGTIINDNISTSIPAGSMMAIRKVVDNEWDFI